MGNFKPWNSALRIYLHMAFLMRVGDLNKEQNKELLKRFYNCRGASKPEASEHSSSLIGAVDSQ